MAAKLVIHAEIETPDDLFETIGMFLQKAAGNPFELQRVVQYFVGVAHALTQTKTETQEPFELEGEAKS